VFPTSTLPTPPTVDIMASGGVFENTPSTPTESIIKEVVLTLIEINSKCVNKG